MQVIICGAGQVGFNIARYLASENADITVIDRSPELVKKISDSLDVKGLVGFASYPEVLERAGARDADMVIAVTYADEVNMVACQVCHSLFGVPTKIARVRHQSYLQPGWSDLFSADNMPIDVIISPEREVAKAILRRLEVPGAFDVIPLAGGKVTLVGLHCTPDTPILGTPLRELTLLFPELSMTVVGIWRRGIGMVASSSDELHAGDDVYFVADTEHLGRALAAYGHQEREARRVVVIGGGNIGFNLAKMVEDDHPEVSLKLIEIDKARAHTIAQELDRCVVINGSALDTEILEEVNIGSVETVVAVSNDDETNILASLLAKRYGSQRAVTLVNNISYGDLISALGVDTVVSPRSITVSTILQHVRRGRVNSVHSLREGFGEVIEAEALETASLVGTPLRAAKLPDGVVIGALVRHGKVVMPRGDDVIEPGDLVVMFAASKSVRKAEKLFAVRLEFF